MAYTTIDDPTEYFETTLFTGNGSTQNITGLNFQPDWIWYKRRNSANHNRLIDSVRGSNKNIATDLANAENTEATYVSSFNSDGWSIGSNTDINASNDTIVAWAWKAGTAFSNDASSTSVGSIDSAGSVNTTAGFSIIGYTGTGSAGTIAHGLGVKPSFILFKNRERAVNWLVYDKKNGANKFLYLNVTDAIGDDSGHFNDTEPTTSVFSVGGANGTNYSGENLIAYCFADVKGYSKLGRYVGLNSSNGNFVYTGFRPAIIFMKRIDAIGDWRIYDDKRDGFNQKNDYLEPSTNDAESDTDSGSSWDILSNGFKFYTSEAAISGSGTFIYFAIAHSPFVNSKGVPNNAR
jgi:hypothetical protein